MPKLIAHNLSQEEFSAIVAAQEIKTVEKNANISKVRRIEPEKASFISKLFWFWVTELVDIANRTPLTDDHLGDTPKDSKTDFALEIFDKEWAKQKQKPNPSIIYALFGTYRSRMLQTGVVEVLLKCSQLVVPIIVQLLLKWYATGDGTTGVGLGYCFFLLGSTLLFQGLIQCHNFITLFKTGMDVRTILCARIYEKALTISAADKAKLTTGEIVNLMSADAEKIVFAVLMFHGIWTTPLFLIGAIWLLVNLVGAAIAPGLGMILLMAPIQGYVIATQHKLQAAVMKVSDQRVKLVNEVLQGVRVVKYYNWEESFQERLAESRRKELVLIRRLAHINGVNNTLMTTVPMLMLIAMLVTFYLTGGDFKPETIFVAVSLLVLIRFPLIMLPMTIGMCVMGSISLHRIQRFLLFDDMPRFDQETSTKIVRKNHKPNGSIDVFENDFSWAHQLPDEQTATSPTASSPSASSPMIKKSKQKTKVGDAKAGQFANLPSSSSSTGGIGVSGGVEAEDTVDAWSLKLDQFALKPGTLLAVTGRVGAGKSSLLAALLGELDVGDNYAASPVMFGSVSYAPQQPWIMNATLRENITFGKPFDEVVYRQVIDCCCLGPDLATLPAGDRTEIGEKGINLSGGQKARVGLARAVYADSDIILLDDVLAAVDAHVGRKLFEACILGRLRGRGRTVVLVTNQLSLLSEVDDVIVVENGTMAEHGTCEELRNKKHGAFSKLMETYVPEEDNEVDDENDEGMVVKTEKKKDNAEDAHDSGKQVLRTEEEKGVLVEEEVKAVGTVGAKVYKAYFVDSVGGSYFNVFSLLFFAIAAQCATLVFEWWLAYWSDAWAKKDDKDKELSKSENLMFMLVYVGLGLFAILLGLFRYLNHARHSTKAAEGLFAQLLNGVLMTSVEFFDVTPVGRILNRFAKDTDANDTVLPQNLMSLDFCLMTVLSTLTMSAVMMPPFILILIPVLIKYFNTLFRYVPLSRDLQRLESISRSPIFAQFSETLSGTATIRAFGRAEDFILNNRKRLDNANRSFYILQSSNRWLQIRLEALGSVIIFSVAMIIVWSRAEREDNLTYGGVGPILGNSITVGIAGLVLTYTQQITSIMNWAVRMACEVENRMTNVERNCEYADLEPEELPERDRSRSRSNSRSRGRSYSGSSGGRRRSFSDLTRTTKKVEAVLNIRKDWPVNGAIEFKNVNMRYRAGLPLVLKNVNLSLPGGSKVGFCGRSGSGKSSILVALFRMTNVEGIIELDGVNTASLRLKELRRAVGIIPQDPVLFVGNLRDNLDAFHEYTDAEIHEALRCACLDTAEVRKQHPNMLEASVDEGGSNWSTGQRQLICLARAVLRAPKVLAIDEATANIDLETDAIVQKSIRTKFKDATTITIAHRLQTILDSDIIVTMDDGIVAECDSPSNLLANSNSLFSALVLNDKGAASAAGLTTSSSSSNLLNQAAEENAQ